MPIPGRRIKWIDRHRHIDRERVLEAMRTIRAKSDRHLKLSQQLSPKYGYTPLGHEHYREFLHGECLAEFLRAIGWGSNPDQAEAEAKQWVSDSVWMWNKNPRCAWVNGPWEVEVWEHCEDAMIEWAKRLVLDASNPLKER